MTFLVPVLFIGMIALVAFLTSRGGDEVTRIEVIDQSGIFADKFKDSRNVDFERAAATDLVQAKAAARKNDAFVLFIPANVVQEGNAELASEKKPPLVALNEVRSQMNEVLRNRMLADAGINPETLKSIDPEISITSKELTEEGEQDTNTGALYGISFASAILIYICLFVYGAQVMRGVIEEKTSRIVEVIISSVKPFQLMLGKIIGIGLVGITQFLLWIILSTTLASLAGQQLLGDRIESLKNMDPEQMEQINKNAGNAPEVTALLQGMENVPIAYIVTVFLIYFLGGYLLYSALFAAVGSAVDNETETQQFMLPITLPLLFTYIMAFSFIANNPNSTLSFWLSIIPFTSPIAMMVRLPFGVPDWELALSIALLVVGFIFTTWVAARIYRVGILMYGKKANYKELMKWFLYKA